MCQYVNPYNKCEMLFINQLIDLFFFYRLFSDVNKLSGNLNSMNFQNSRLSSVDGDSEGSFESDSSPRTRRQRPKRGQKHKLIPPNYIKSPNQQYVKSLKNIILCIYNLI